MWLFLSGGVTPPVTDCRRSRLGKHKTWLGWLRSPSTAWRRLLLLRDSWVLPYRFKWRSGPDLLMITAIDTFFSVGSHYYVENARKLYCDILKRKNSIDKEKLSYSINIY